MKWPLLLAFVVVLAAALFFFFEDNKLASPIRVAIAPYQDLAMIVNAKPLGLEEKYGTRLDILTMGWEEILPAVASAGRGADVGFGSYIEYLTKYNNLNKGSSDPVLFVYPAYVFKGGAFVAFNPAIESLNKTSLKDKAALKKFLSLKIGAQKGSVYEMMLQDMAERAGMLPSDKLNVIDTPLDQGFLAVEQGSLDTAAAGLTQLTEVERQGGKAVLTMDDLGFADITGFIVKKSVWDNRKQDVENVIRMWFDCVNYVLADINKNSQESMSYLNKNASTHYSLDEYKSALGNEYLPRSIKEAKTELIDDSGKFPYRRIGASANKILVREKVISEESPLPKFPDIRE